MYIDVRNHPAIATTADFLDALNRADPYSPDEAVALLAKADAPGIGADRVWSEIVVADWRQSGELFSGVTQTTFNGAVLTFTHSDKTFFVLNVSADAFAANITTHHPEDPPACPAFKLDPTSDDSMLVSIELVRGDPDDYLDWAKRTGVMLKLFA